MSHEVQMLEALLLRKKQEAQEIMTQLDIVRSGSRPVPPTDYQPPRPTFANNGRSRSNTMPRNAPAASSFKAEGIKEEVR